MAAESDPKPHHHGHKRRAQPRPAPSKRVEAQCMLWVHDEHYSREDVLFNASHFPQVPAGALLEVLISASTENIGVKDFISAAAGASNGYADHQNKGGQDHSGSATPLRGADGPAVGKNLRQDDTLKNFVFEASDVGDDDRPKYPGLQLSVCTKVARLFGFTNRMTVTLALADRSIHEVSHCEITFRDLYLSRNDIRMATPFIPKVVYLGQELVLLGAIKTTIKSVYNGGKKALCGCFTDATKPIFRSESSRFVLYIQMSSEMWTFDSDGEIMFSKVIDGFLPDLFRRWSRARHLVSIVLFSRIEQIIGPQEDHSHLASTKAPKTRKRPHSTQYQDFYRVVVTEMINTDSRKILFQLKKEFKNFLRDTCTSHKANRTSLDGGSDATSIADANEVPLITGYPSPARKGNVLEAINVAFSQFPREYIEQDLVRTGLSVVIITPGTGAFEVDEALLRLTTDNLVNSGAAVDLVCLSPPPLHSVPLFKYQSTAPSSERPVTATRDGGTTSNVSQHGKTSTSQGPALENPFITVEQPDYANNLPFDSEAWNMTLPHWCNISFYTGSMSASVTPQQHRNFGGLRGGRFPDTDFVPRCRMYEIQTSGLMEDEMSNISIPFLHQSWNAPVKDNPPTLLSTGVGMPRSRLTKSDSYDSTRSSERTIRANLMDAYDEHLFSRLSKAHSESDNSFRSHGDQKIKGATTIKAAKRPTPSRENSYVSSDVSAKRKSSQSSFIDKAKGSTRAVQPAAPPSSKNDDDDSKSIVSVKKASRASSHLLLGGLGKALPAKAVASTGISQAPDMATSTTANTTNAGHSGADERSFTISRQIRSSLLRQASSPVAPQRGHRKVRAGSVQRSPSATSRNSDQDSIITSDTQSPSGKGDAISKLSKRVGSQEDLSFPRGDDQFFISRRKMSVGSLIKPSVHDHQSPWLSVINPSNPKSEKNNQNIISRFNTWLRFLPRSRQSSTMKWTSICIPAVLPLTNEASTSLEEAHDLFEESVHKVAANEEQLSDIPVARATLIAKIVNFRLARGFQVMLRSSKAKDGKLPGNLNFLDEAYLSVEGVSLCMSKGNTIHHIIASGNEIQIICKQRKRSSYNTLPRPYTPFIRTALSPAYQKHSFALSVTSDDLNWSLADNFIAGHAEGAFNPSQVGRARFVFIPAEPNRRALPGLHDDTEDDIRVEGIQKLSQMWERSRVITADARRVYVRANAPKDPNPLGLEFQTRDPSAVVAAGLELSLLSEREHVLASTNLFSGNESFRSSNIDMNKIAQEMQGERGIKIQDRRWHLKFHAECFIGFEMTSWLLENFKDVSTREEAVELGQQLMDQGLFSHVIKKQKFRDANFFYRLAEKYKKSRADSRSSWFSRRPLSLTSNESADDLSDRSRPRTGTNITDSPGRVSSPQFGKKLQVKLSSVLHYDADLRRKSYRSEVINLHYDRLYNPFSCYCVRIEFFSVTAKLVDDAISNWAQTAERYGLRMVQVPISEMSIIGDINQFRTPHKIELALKPPDTPVHLSHYFDIQSLPVRPANEQHSHQKALLRKLNYVLDRESSSSFPVDVDVTYSWGRGVYKYTQYIHKTGQLLVQIDDDGDLLLFTNQLYSTRHISAKEAQKWDKTNTSNNNANINNSNNDFGGDRRPLSGIQVADKFSPMSSPRLRGSDIMSSPLTVPFTDTQRLLGSSPEQLRDELEAFCSNKEALAEFYDEVTKPSASSHPDDSAGGGGGGGSRAWATGASGGNHQATTVSERSTPSLDPTIPKLGLPPSLRIDEVLATLSPSPMPSQTPMSTGPAAAAATAAAVTRPGTSSGSGSTASGGSSNATAKGA